MNFKPATDEPCASTRVAAWKMVVFGLFVAGIATTLSCSDETSSECDDEECGETASESDCPDETTDRDDGDDEFDIDECLAGDEDAIPESYFVADTDDFDEIPEEERRCTRRGITVDDQDGVLDDLEPLRHLRRAGHQLILGVGDVCEAGDPDCDSSRERSNEKLTSLCGLRSLREVGGLEVTQVAAESLDGLQELERTGFLWFRGETPGPRPEFESLQGLDNLQSIENDLGVESMPELKRLEGLNAVREIGGDLILYANDKLRDVSALHGVEAVGGDLRIANNDELAPCRAERLVEEIGEENIGGEVVMTGNDGEDDC